MINKIFLLFSVLIISNTHAQIGVKNSFLLASESIRSSDSFLGNGIVDILVKDNIVWAATGFGLNKSTNQGQTWESFSAGNYNSKGGVTAMTFMDDSTLWLATAFDTTAGDDDLSAGGGLSYTRDGGLTWTHVAQPVDPRETEDYKPTTTVIQNITFDIATVDSTIWIASFGGGLRKSTNMGISWQVKTTDGKSFSSLDELNHRAFSLLSENGNLWYGSAAGISMSPDNGETWQRFNHQNQEFPISGNFVVALAHQPATNTIWAATIQADREIDDTEFTAVSKSTNGGITWDIVLKGVFAHNFSFDGNTVFVAADTGLVLSENGGEDWYLLPPVIDSESGDEILKGDYPAHSANGIHN